MGNEDKQFSIDFEKLASALEKINSTEKLIVFFILVVFLGTIIGLLVAVQCNMPDDLKVWSYIILTIVTFLVITRWVSQLINHIDKQAGRKYSDKEKKRKHESDENERKHKRELELIASNKDIELEKIKFASPSFNKGIQNSVLGDENE